MTYNVYQVRDKRTPGIAGGQVENILALTQAVRNLVRNSSVVAATEDIVRTINEIERSGIANLAALKVLHGEDGPHLPGQEVRIEREIKAMSELLIFWI